MESGVSPDPGGRRPQRTDIGSGIAAALWGMEWHPHRGVPRATAAPTGPPDCRARMICRPAWSHTVPAGAASAGVAVVAWVRSRACRMWPRQCRTWPCLRPQWQVASMTKLTDVLMDETWRWRVGRPVLGERESCLHVLAHGCLASCHTISVPSHTWTM